MVTLAANLSIVARTAGAEEKQAMAREYPERPVVGVGGVVIEDGRALLIRRGSEPLRGQWSIPKFHYVIIDYLCERIGGQACAGSDVTAVAFAREDELEKFQLTPTATRVLQKAFAMVRERSVSRE